MPHDHNNEISPSGHPYRKDQDYPLTYWQNLEIAVREILVGKKIMTEIEIQETMSSNLNFPVKEYQLVEFRALQMACFIITNLRQTICSSDWHPTFIKKVLIFIFKNFV